MGWKSLAVITDYVIIEGPNDGLFVYNGTPAAGNLITSITQSSGTDPFGNALLSGVSTYVPGIAEAVTTAGAELSFYSGPSGGAGPWTLQATLAGNSTATLICETDTFFITGTGGTPATSAFLEVKGQAAIQPTKAAGVTGTPGLTVGAPPSTGDAIVHIADDPANPRSGSANMLQIEDHSAAPIFAVGAAGGAKVFGDKMGAWNGIGSMAAQFVPWYGMQTGGSSGPTIYGGSGAPLPALITGGLTTYSATAHVGDYYFRTDTPAVANQRLYVCTVAGNPGTWVGIL